MKWGRARRRWRGLVIAGLSVSGVLLLGVTLRQPWTSGAPPAVSAGGVSMRDFHTALYDDDRLAIRIAGETLRITNTRVFGPFSLGFAHALRASHVTIDLFPREEQSTATALQALSVERVTAALRLDRLNLTLTDAEVAPLTVIEHRGTDATVALQAAACRAALLRRSAVCRDGVLGSGAQARRFRELRYDTETQRVTTVP